MKIISNDLLKLGEKSPKIEFPCDYPIKILGDAHEAFTELVISAIKTHAPDVDETKVTLKQSSKGRFVSVTVIIRATGPEQIEALFSELKMLDAVKMVL